MKIYKKTKILQRTWLERDRFSNKCVFLWISLNTTIRWRQFLKEYNLEWWSKIWEKGIFNRHNLSYWIDNNLLLEKRDFQDNWNFNVYCAVQNNRAICLHIYKETVNTNIYFIIERRYLDILQNIELTVLDIFPLAKPKVIFNTIELLLIEINDLHGKDLKCTS